MRHAVEYIDDLDPDHYGYYELTATITPYVPASMYGGADNLGWPAEGGDVEVYSVRLLRYTLLDDAGCKEKDVALDDATVKQMEAAMLKREDINDLFIEACGN